MGAVWCLPPTPSIPTDLCNRLDWGFGLALQAPSFFDGVNLTGIDV